MFEREKNVKVSVFYQKLLLEVINFKGKLNLS